LGPSTAIASPRPALNVTSRSAGRGAPEPAGRPAAALALPYAGWVAFAGALNQGIVDRNPRA
jgi:hypothetical protein